MFDRGPFGGIDSNFGQNALHGEDIQPINLGEVHASHVIQLGAYVKGWVVFGASPGGATGGRSRCFGPLHLPRELSELLFNGSITKRAPNCWAFRSRCRNVRWRYCSSS